MEEVTTRRADVADAVAVQHVVNSAYAPYVGRIGRRPAPMDQNYIETLASSLSWVALTSTGVVGVVVTYVEGDHLLVENVAVHPRAHGHGIGGRLLSLAEAHASDTGRVDVRLYANEAMHENIEFYGRRGYIETGRAEQEGFRRVFFTKRLSS